jgi:hypothetical protein
VIVNPVMTGNGVAGSTGILGLYPPPNLANNQFTYPIAAPSTVNWGQIRVDENISASDTLFGRYTTDKSFLVSPSVAKRSRGISLRARHPPRSAQDYTFSPISRINSSANSAGPHR